MKKFILSALAPLFIFVYTLFPTPPKATAKAYSLGEYACVLSDNAYFYPDPQGKRGLFILPKTYYVKILEVGESFCRVEYLYDDAQSRKLVGYARTEELTFVEYVPKRPYPYKQFEISYRLDNADGSGVLDELVLTCVYYGDYAVGSETYCYVLRGEDFGYVPRPTNLTVEPNPEYAEWQAQNAPSTAPPSSDAPETGSPVQIAVLVSLCLLVPVLAALILRPPRDIPYDD